MKIAIVCDVPEWAIGHLAQSVAKYNKHHQIKLMYVHPRDAGDVNVQQNFLKEIKEFNPDLIDFEYFRTAGQLVEALPELHNYKLLVMHHNMRTKALYMWDWQNNPKVDKVHLNFDTVCAHCNKTAKLMKDAGVAKDVEIVRYGFDHDFWTYDNTEPDEFTLGYGGRVVPWKGLKEIAEVGEELDIPVQMMGKQDKPDYWEKIPKSPLRFDFLDCKDEERVDFYRNITVFVQNSIDGYEEGPMPMLEAMACGVPVITTPAGQAGYEEGIFRDRDNCLLIPFEDKEALKKAVIELRDNKELRDKIRENGWNTVKNMTEEKMARNYSSIWYKTVYPNRYLASVIIPATYNRIEQVNRILDALEKQTYSNIEAVIAWDELKQKSAIDKTKYRFAIKETWTDLDKTKYPYNLAKARNQAVIEAEGDVLIFNDSRLLPDENAVLMFVESISNARSITQDNSKKVWFFGDKGSQKASFVENFSAIDKFTLIKAGMFCERIDRYGGMTQELRSRWSKQGGIFQFVPSAVSEEMLTSGRPKEKRQDIVKSKLKLFKMFGEERL